MAKNKQVKPDFIDIAIRFSTDQARIEYHKLAKENQNLAKEIEECQKKMDTIDKTTADGKKAWNDLNKELNANQAKLKVNQAQMDELIKVFDKSGMTMSELRKHLKDLNKAFENTSKKTQPEQYERLRKQIEETRKAMSVAAGQTDSLKESFLSLNKFEETITGFFFSIGEAIFNGVVGAFKSLKETIQGFESANSQLAAILGTTKDGIQALTEQAKELGRTTTATASEVTGLQTELAKLGFTMGEIQQMTPGVLKFSKTVGTDLSSAAAFAGATLRIFGKDASHTDEVLSTLAVSTTKSALDFSKLQASMATLGPVANAYGLTLEDTTALLGVLSNAGFDASSAATAARNIILKLCDANSQLAISLGSPAANLDEICRGMIELKQRGADLGEMLDMTDKRSVTAFATLTDGAQSVLDLRNSITGCTEDFDQMAATMADNSAAAEAGFGSAVEGLILKFSGLNDVIRLLYEWGTNIINWLGELVEAFRFVGNALMFVVNILSSLIGGLATVVGWFTRLFTQTRAGQAILKGLVAGLVIYKIAAILTSEATKKFCTNVLTSVKSAGAFVKALALKAKALITDAVYNVKAAIATRTFNAALMANPIMLVVGLIATLVTAIYSYCSATDDAAEKTDAWSEASREASRQYGEQKGKIEALILVAENENLSLERRKRAEFKLVNIY